MLWVSTALALAFVVLTSLAQRPLTRHLDTAGAPPAAPYEPARDTVLRLLGYGALLVVAPLVLLWILGGPAAAALPAAIAAGSGVGRLLTARRVGRWEEARGERALGAGGGWWGGGELFVGEPEPWRGPPAPTEPGRPSPRG